MSDYFFKKLRSKDKEFIQDNILVLGTNKRGDSKTIFLKKYFLSFINKIARYI